jgi:hypothetical protein
MYEAAQRVLDLVLRLSPEDRADLAAAILTSLEDHASDLDQAERERLQAALEAAHAELEAAEDAARGEK